MKKIAAKIAVLFTALVFSAGAARADVVVEGKAKVSHSGGTTYVKCRKSGECIRITAGSITTYHAMVFLEDDSKEEYDFDSYTIVPNDVEGGDDVTLFDVQ